MTQIEIPFKPEMAVLILLGRKTATSRYKQYGDAGDTFPVRDPRNDPNADEPLFLTKYYVLTNVTKRKVSEIARFSYEAEGFIDGLSFIETWIEIHPKRSFKPSDMVWYHEFKEVFNAP